MATQLRILVSSDSFENLQRAVWRYFYWGTRRLERGTLLRSRGKVRVYACEFHHSDGKPVVLTNKYRIRDTGKRWQFVGVLDE